jgi:hypothetical protein
MQVPLGIFTDSSDDEPPLAKLESQITVYLESSISQFAERFVVEFRQILEESDPFAQVPTFLGTFLSELNSEIQLTVDPLKIPNLPIDIDFTVPFLPIDSPPSLNNSISDLAAYRRSVPDEFTAQKTNLVRAIAARDSVTMAVQKRQLALRRKFVALEKCGMELESERRQQRWASMRMHRETAARVAAGRNLGFYDQKTLLIESISGEISQLESCCEIILDWEIPMHIEKLTESLKLSGLTRQDFPTHFPRVDIAAHPRLYR